ncbi:hypothetical protein GUITHDRAFT_67997 [Guillardia theta CCMP2712]|uniref:O-GlcNAc transferase C-terminal domain-containing protein n=1 Tax=Guillardia theta (strain CCMP2712) TaxID=905079 RepID=L1JMJ1_GUITC|nr:hypothetical protein GUITHDRAFT_67997 [Guillardia theta CCMP2712]EKX49420.1 hypothetical protein GUITHDRAFT_67997 [Guillardia theta CCMP2712]|eukprot:XP_005836400.1 hypothetical protein GUITHDRAFT_67997 [Guillardia theta CCMP2712]
MQIHILVDLSGHTGGTRLSALSLRPTPVIISFLGYGSTTGASFVDYFLSDHKASPPEMSYAHSETFAYLPVTYYPFNTRQAIDSTPSYEDVGIARGQTSFIFACFNRNLKIKPDVFEVWMKVLKAVPRSVLWLRRFHIRVQENLLRHAERLGVSNASIIFAGRIPDRSKHLARHRLADLFLDTPRFGGHSTLADVFWAGVPSLVIPGEGASSRIGASMASALNGSVFIARDLHDYQQLAIQLASQVESVLEEGAER